ASGKTTLARRLAPELGLVRLCKDELREVIGDWLPPRTYADTKSLGRAAYALCVRLASETLESGIGVLIEAAFSRGSAEADARAAGGQVTRRVGASFGVFSAQQRPLPCPLCARRAAPLAYGRAC